MDEFNVIRMYVKEEQEKGAILNNGADKSHLMNSVGIIKPFKLSKELEYIYSICDGSDSNERFLYFSNLLPLEEAVDAYKELFEITKEVGLEWPKKLFPIGQGDGSYLLTEISSEETSFITGRIFFFDIGSGELDLTVEAESLLQLIIIIRDLKKSKNIVSMNDFDMQRKSVTKSCFQLGQKSERNGNGVQTVFNLTSEEDMKKIS